MACLQQLAADTAERESDTRVVRMHACYSTTHIATLLESTTTNLGGTKTQCCTLAPSVYGLQRAGAALYPLTFPSLLCSREAIHL